MTTSLFHFGAFLVCGALCGAPDASAFDGALPRPVEAAQADTLAAPAGTHIAAAPAGTAPADAASTPAAAPAENVATSGDDSTPASTARTDPADGPTSFCCALPAGTPVSLEIVDTVNSGIARRGDRVRLRLSAPLSLGDRLLLPAGIEGVGEVIHAERARGGGKAGELIVSARYLDGPHGRVRLRALKLGGSGKDNSKTALGVAAAVGLFGLLVRGGELEIPAGTEAQAKLVDPMPAPTSVPAPAAGEPPPADAAMTRDASADARAPATPLHHTPAIAPDTGGEGGDNRETDLSGQGGETPLEPATSP